MACAGREQRVPRPLGRPPNVESQVTRLEVCGSKHWPILSEMQLRCHVCKARGVTQKAFVKCCKCELGLHVKKICFEDYHTKARPLSENLGTQTSM